MSEARRVPPAMLDDAALEAALIDLGGALAVPPAPDMAASVGARLRARPFVSRRPTTPWRLRWALVAALVALLVLAAIAAGGGFGLPGLRILFATPPPTSAPTVAPSAPGPSATAAPSGDSSSPSATALESTAVVPTAATTPGPAAAPTPLAIGGTRMTLDAARRAVGFTIALPDPAVVGAGQPLVSLDRDVTGGEVSLAYVVADGAEAAGLPVAPDGKGRIAFLLTESLGRTDESILGKMLGVGNAITSVDVGRGTSGFWIRGPVHELLVFDPDGGVREAKTRDVGDVLVWNRDGTLFRLETTLGLDRALHIARSVP